MPYSDLDPFRRPNGPEINIVKGFIPGPFGLRKGPRSEYGIDFKTKK